MSSEEFEDWSVVEGGPVEAWIEIRLRIHLFEDKPRYIENRGIIGKPRSKRAKWDAPWSYRMHGPQPDVSYLAEISGETANQLTRMAKFDEIESALEKCITELNKKTITAAYS